MANPQSDLPTGPRSLIGRLVAVGRGALGSTRLRSEAAWIIIAQFSQFAASFLLLKFLTTWLTQDQYGEYGLAQAAMLLMLYTLLSPVSEAFLRHYHKAEESGKLGGSGRFLLGWYGGVSLIVVALAIVLTAPLGWLLSIGSLTAVATALVFVTDRWRALGIEVLDVRRERRQMGMNTLLFLALQVVLTVVVVWYVQSATAALFAWSAAALIPAWLIIAPLWRRIRSEPRVADPEFRRAIFSFGTPFAALLICQWVQQSADRFVIAQLLDKGSAGLYVAALQVCGLPFVMLSSFICAMVKPMAYERARDVSDPRQLWAADRVLLMGVGGYVLIGLVGLGLFFLVGPPLVVLLTSDEYQLSRWSIMALAASRFLQMLPLVLQPIFAVHHRMVSSLALRATGAATTIPACWIGVLIARPHGADWSVFAAAVGTAIAVALYVLLLVFSPGGCYGLVRESRRAAVQAAQGEPRV